MNKTLVLILAFFACACSTPTYTSQKPTSVTIYNAKGRQMFFMDLDEAVTITLCGDIEIKMPEQNISDKVEEEAK